MKKHTIFLLLLVTVATMNCSKDNTGESLPPITTIGANTFGCKVDGKVWIPYSPISSFPQIISSYYSNELTIFARNRKNGEKSDLNIIVKNLISLGTYKIKNQLNKGLVYSSDANYEPFDTFGVVNILRYDTIQKIVAGTFSFVGKNIQYDKTINISDGRFDLHYPYQK